MIVRDLKILIKDTVRGARFAVRRSANAGLIPETLLPPGLADLAGEVARTLDRDISGILGAGTQSAGAALADLAALAQAEDADLFEDRLVRDLYALTKAVFSILGIENAFIAQQFIARMAKPLWTCRDSADPSLFFAHLALQMLAVRPIRMIDSPGAAGSEAPIAQVNESVALALGLSATVQARNPTAPAEACLRSSVETVEAARKRFTAALRASQKPAALARLYKDLAAFLP